MIIFTSVFYIGDRVVVGWEPITALKLYNDMLHCVSRAETRRIENGQLSISILIILYVHNIYTRGIGLLRDKIGSVIILNELGIIR